MGLMLFSTGLWAQSSFFKDETKTFYENGYTYQYDKSETEIVRLYNKENRLTYDTQYVYKDGTKANLYNPWTAEFINVVEFHDWTIPTCESIVNNAFSREEKEQLKGHNLITKLALDPSTGHVTEVDFSFRKDGPFSSIPISTFRKIEIELKEKIWLTITEEGKKLQFIFFSWGQDPSKSLLTENESDQERVDATASESSAIPANCD